jgi:hypothetical protein
MNQSFIASVIGIPKKLMPTSGQILIFNRVSMVLGCDETSASVGVDDGQIMATIAESGNLKLSINLSRSFIRAFFKA